MLCDILCWQRLTATGASHRQRCPSLHPLGFNATKVNFRGRTAFGPPALEDPSASQNGPGPQVLLVLTRNLMILGTIRGPCDNILGSDSDPICFGIIL